jgi:hypothetical protein
MRTLNLNEMSAVGGGSIGLDDIWQGQPQTGPVFEVGATGRGDNYAYTGEESAGGSLSSAIGSVVGQVAAGLRRAGSDCSNGAQIGGTIGAFVPVVGIVNGAVIGCTANVGVGIIDDLFGGRDGR